jgi:hypothetical protein
LHKNTWGQIQEDIKKAKEKVDEEKKKTEDNPPTDGK